jgi:hypothetical protein
MQGIHDHPQDPKAQKGNISLGFSGFMLPATAWETAQSTGALGYMPYDEAKRYSEIYKAQGKFMATEEKREEDAPVLLGLISKYHLQDDRKLTATQADALSETLGRMRMHLALSDGLLQLAIQEDSSFLENREGNANINAIPGGK